MEYLRQLFEYNARFANEVVKSLRTVDMAKFVDEKVSGWGSLRNLVVHLIEAEDYWVNKIIQGKEFTEYDFDDFNDIDAIEKKWKENEADILLLLEGMRPGELKREIKVKWDREYSFPLERILQHVYTHTVHHRGQAVAAIRKLDGNVPCVDII